MLCDWKLISDSIAILEKCLKFNQISPSFLYGLFFFSSTSPHPSLPLSPAFSPRANVASSQRDMRGAERGTMRERDGYNEGGEEKNEGRELGRNRKVKRLKGGRSRERQAALVWVITLCTWLVSVGFFWLFRRSGNESGGESGFHSFTYCC